MDYNQPTGGNPGDPYIGKNIVAGIQGSKVPPHAVEYPQREIVNAITAAGLTPNNGDLTQLSQAIKALIKLPAGPVVRLAANLVVAGTAVTFTADEIGVATGLGGIGVTIGGFNKTLSTSTVGAGGMDTGTLPASGFLSIYAILNPITGVSALLGTIACQSTVYIGAHMPAGYTMSALVGIWQINSSLLVAASIVDSEYYSQQAIVGQDVLNASNATSPTAVSLSTPVPAAARAVYVNVQVVDAGAIDAFSAGIIASTSAGNVVMFIGVSVTNAQLEQQAWVPLVTPQTIYYASGDSQVSTSVHVLGYRI